MKKVAMLALIITASFAVCVVMAVSCDAWIKQPNYNCNAVRGWRQAEIQRYLLECAKSATPAWCEAQVGKLSATPLQPCVETGDNGRTE